MGILMISLVGVGDEYTAMSQSPKAGHGYSNEAVYSTLSDNIQVSIP